jgi:hypothetical protein
MTIACTIKLYAAALDEEPIGRAEISERLHREIAQGRQWFQLREPPQPIAIGPMGMEIEARSGYGIIDVKVVRIGDADGNSASRCVVSNLVAQDLVRSAKGSWRG